MKNDKRTDNKQIFSAFCFLGIYSIFLSNFDFCGIESFKFISLKNKNLKFFKVVIRNIFL